jgi:hypothetical protein
VRAHGARTISSSIEAKNDSWHGNHFAAHLATLRRCRLAELTITYEKAGATLVVLATSRIDERRRLRAAVVQPFES